MTRMVCGARYCTRPASTGGVCRDHGEAHQFRQAARVLRGGR